MHRCLCDNAARFGVWSMMGFPQKCFSQNLGLRHQAKMINPRAKLRALSARRRAKSEAPASQQHPRKSPVAVWP